MARIAFVGEEAAGARAVGRVVASDHELVCALTDSSPTTRGSVAAVATGAGAPVLPGRRVRDAALADELRALGVDVLLNVHSLAIVRREVLAAPRIGAFNLHPGPLPAYAGLNVPSWAVLHRAPRHGVTLHWMEPGIDTGDVVARADFDLTPCDTGLSVATRCAQEGVELVGALLDRLDDDPAAVPRAPQDLADRHYYGREVPQDGWIPWSLPTADVLAFVRAFDYRPFPSPWGPARAAAPEVGEIGIPRLTAAPGAACAEPGRVRVDDEHVDVATGDGWVRMLGLTLGGRSTSPREVLRDGAVLTAPVPVGR
ncbi:methionyl-tRNA formyltransferase [Actinomycetospora sp. CA-084318]|uniref:methionyl-tRNA formyltransferase n=1 Tax=Actinomycetospora sp. CA-084318 TaxID=3239892 RepID=UPI003D98DACE